MYPALTVLNMLMSEIRKAVLTACCVMMPYGGFMHLVLFRLFRTYREVHDPLADFLGAALIPELGADIPAGSSGNIHAVLITVAAIRAFPDELPVILNDADFAVETAALAEIALRIELGIHDVVIDEFHDSENSIEIPGHIGDFHIADGTAW